MIVVFVVDTSSSMGQPCSSRSGSMKKLDLAKCLCELIAKNLDRRVQEHNNAVSMQQLQQKQTTQHQQINPLHQAVLPDQYLLLSTTRQDDNCLNSGLLLVGFPGGNYDSSCDASSISNMGYPSSYLRNHSSFERELKKLKVKSTPEDEESGGITGLNMSLSAGFQLLSRYRLHQRRIENFGMGRNLWSAALQPAILILFTDGECLSKGDLTLQFGNMPLREFYREPFRWDQRFFCVTVGNETRDGHSSQLHPSLEAFCDVTGGSHFTINESSKLNSVADALLREIAPRRPSKVPISDPLQMPFKSVPVNNAKIETASLPNPPSFVNGGPICTFQCIEQQHLIYRAMLLREEIENGSNISSPSSDSTLWCIPGKDLKYLVASTTYSK